MEPSIWRARGVRVAVVGILAAVALCLALYPRLPDTVVQHGTWDHPDSWTSKHSWLLFELTFVPGIAAFVMLLVIGTTGSGPGALNLNDPAQRAYWTVPERWPEARRRVVDVLGCFVGVFAVALALFLTGSAGGYAWGLPFWSVWLVPLVVLVALAGWLGWALHRTLRVPADGR